MALEGLTAAEVEERRRALGDGLDQARKERPNLKAIVERERVLAAFGGRETHADIFPVALDRGEELRGNVMGVNVDGHSLLLAIK